MIEPRTFFRLGYEEGQELLVQSDSPAEDYLRRVVARQEFMTREAVEEWSAGYQRATADHWGREIVKRINAVFDRDPIRGLELAAEILDIALRANGE